MKNIKNKKKYALIVASVASMISQFNMENIKLLKKLGYTVEVAANFEIGNTCNDKELEKLKITLNKLHVEYHQIDFYRNALNLLKNFKAYNQLKKIATKKNYSVVHCHSPIGGVVTRLVFKKYRKFGTKIIYTAHGFHFYKGAQLINWLTYYPIEKYLSKFTDVLITINKEDYHLAKNKFRAKKVEYSPGIGIDLNKFYTICISKITSLKKNYNVPSDKFVLFSAGELNKNKNHSIVIEAIKDIPDIYYYIVGKGILYDDLVNLINKYNLKDRVKLFGYRNDIVNLYHCCDAFVMPSLREGLPVVVMEAMACGKMCIVSNIRGNVDLIDEPKGGYLFNPNKSDELKEVLKKVLIKEPSICRYNVIKIRKQFNTDKVKIFLKKIYLQSI